MILLSRAQVQYQLIKSIKFSKTIEHHGLRVLTGDYVQKKLLDI